MIEHTFFLPIFTAAIDEKYFITEIVKNFGVHICIPQSTADYYHRGGANMSPPGPGWVKA